MKVQFYTDAKSEHRWRVVARNGQIMCDSGEGYKRRAAARHAFWLVAHDITAGEFDIEVKP